jgi:hypothetical protein
MPIPAERIEQEILLIRGQKVMLDSDLAVNCTAFRPRLYQEPSNAIWTGSQRIS